MSSPHDMAAGPGPAAISCFWLVSFEDLETTELRELPRFDGDLGTMRNRLALRSVGRRAIICAITRGVKCALTALGGGQKGVRPGVLEKLFAPVAWPLTHLGHASGSEFARMEASSIHLANFALIFRPPA